MLRKFLQKFPTVPGRFGVKLTVACLLGFSVLLWVTAPAYERVRARELGSDKYFYDQSGQVIEVVRSDHSRRQLPWVDLADVSSDFVDLLVEAEDRRFYIHPGVDPLGIIRAVFKSKWLGAQGGSTITMQLARRMSPMLGGFREHHPVISKVLQTIQAVGLELRWSKKEILTAYLNMVPFRGEHVGLPIAAHVFFDKNASALSLQESGILVAMIRSPNSSDSVLATRACRMIVPRQSSFSHDDCQAIIESRLRDSAMRGGRRYQFPHLIPHLAQNILKTSANELAEYHTDIDINLQRFVMQSIENRLSATIRQNAHDAAAVVVDHRSHKVLAYVGGSGSFSTARFVDGASALRQPGSTLKPFFYARALDRRLITAATVLDDSPAEVAVASGGVYQPRNFDEKFRGPVTVRDSLAGSLNIPAVRVLQMIGIDDGVDVLKSLGMSHLKAGDYYGPGLALGSADVSLFELVRAYTALANHGRFQPITLTRELRDETKSNQVFSAEASVIVRSILADNVARAPTFGLTSALLTSFQTAVKTGTSKDMRDNWCIGFSDRYTVGVWVGNFGGASMWNLTGVAGAAPIWSDVMHYLHRDSGSQFNYPDSFALKSKQMSFSFKKGSVNELFIEGTDPENQFVEALSSSYATRITYPVHDSWMAIDPEIPEDNQRVKFSSTKPSKNMVWSLNGAWLGTADKSIYWSPVKGRHDLAVIEKSTGRTIDRVRFYVR